MEIFFDTNVLAAACVESHSHFARAFPVVARVAEGSDKGFCSNHSIAEIFAALTRMPVACRVGPSEAMRLIIANVSKHFETIPLIKENYFEALEIMAAGGWSGGRIYDALLLRCADKCGAERIYTFDVAHFRQLAPENLVGKICAP